MSSPAPQEPAVVIPAWSPADRLRKIRRDVLGVEQAEMAEKLSVTRQAYQSWESGRSNPRDIVALAKRIEILSGVPAAWTLGIAPGTAGNGVTYHGSNPGNPHENVVDLAERRHASGPIDQVEAA